MRPNSSTNSGSSSAGDRAGLLRALLPELDGFRDVGLGDLAVERGWLSADLLRACQERIDRGIERRPLADLLVGEGLLTSEQIRVLTAELSGLELRDAVSSPLPAEAEAASLDPARRFGRFILCRELGRGGMGTVDRAWQTDLGRWVALKRLRPDSAQGLHRFLREARLAGQVRHPNLVPIYEAGMHGDVPYLAMALIEGGTLEGRRLPAARAMEVMRQVASAVQELHAAGIVHRDIKPANLLVDAAGRVYLGDFGLARGLEEGPSLTRDGVLMGTPGYAPPEQIRGDLRSVGPRSDVYALGATLYGLLAGRAPFTGKDGFEAAARALDSEPPDLPASAGEGRARLETIVHKAMRRRTEERYASPLKFAEDVRRFLDGEPLAARPPGLAERLTLALRRRRRAVAAAAALVLVAGTAGLLLARQARHHDESERTGRERLQRAAERAEWVDRIWRGELLAQDALEWIGVRSRLDPRPPREEVEARRKQLETDLRVLPGDPGLRLARAILARFSFAADGPEEGERRFAELPPEDPSMRVHRARARLARYLTFMEVPGQTLDGMSEVRLLPGDPVPEPERKWKDLAAEDLRRLLDLPAATGLDRLMIGLEALASGRPERAVAPLEEAAARPELRPDALEALGYAWMMQSRHDRAVEAWGAALGARPGRMDLRVRLGMLLLALATREPTRAEELVERAVREIDRVLAEAPGLPSALSARGTAAISRVRLPSWIPRRSEAREELRRAAADFRAARSQGILARLNEGAALALLADAEGNLGTDPLPTLRQALAAYEGLELPDRPVEIRAMFHLQRAVIHLNLGQALLNRGELREAEEHLARCAEQSLRAMDAEPACETRALLARGSARTFLAKSGALRGRPDAAAWEAAERDFARAIELDPEQPRHHFMLAYLLRQRYVLVAPDQPLLDRSLHHAMKAVALPGPAATDLRGQIYYDLGKLAGADRAGREYFVLAAADFKAAMEASPQSAALALRRSLALSRAAAFVKSDRDRWRSGMAEALEEADRSCAWDPSDPAAWYQAGLACEQLGRRADAAERFRRARALEPADAQLRARIDRHLAAMESGD